MTKESKCTGLIPFLTILDLENCIRKNIEETNKQLLKKLPEKDKIYFKGKKDTLLFLLNTYFKRRINE